MRDVRESIGNALTAHGVPLELGIRSTGIDDILIGMDWAMACGLIGPIRAGMLFAKYLDDEQELRKCRAWWLQRVIEYAHIRAWKRPRPHMLEGLAYTSMDEHMGVGTRCLTCNGTRERMIANLPVVCPGCEGRGFLEYSQETYCEAIGCRREDWERVWRSRVEWARRALWQWETDAAQALREVAE